MTGGGFQKGGPGRANSVEGGNFVPVVEVGTKRARPVLRGDLVEGLFDWCPDGTYGIYAGFPVDSGGITTPPNNIVQLYRYDVATNALTDISPTVDCNNIPLSVSAAAITNLQFLAVKFQPFYSPAVAGYLCHILVRVTYAAGPGTTSTQIWVYNGGTIDLSLALGTAVAPPGPGVTAFDLMAGVVNTYDASAPHQCSYFCLPDDPGAIGGPPYTEHWPPAAWDYLSTQELLGTFRDIGFSWGGSSDPAANASQIPYGIVAGDGIAYWGGAAGAAIGNLGGGLLTTGALANMYCIQFGDGSGGTPRFIPYRSLTYVENINPDFPHDPLTSYILKLALFRKGLSAITFDNALVLNQVFEASGNNGITFYQEAALTPPQFGRIGFPFDPTGGGLTFVEIEDLQEYTSGTQELTMVFPAGYVDCVADDIGKTVNSVAGHSGKLLAYNNGAQTWDIKTTSTFEVGDVCSVAFGTGRGTVTAVSWTASLPNIDVNDPTNRPMYTDTTWGPNRNALWVVGREGHIKSTTNRKWMFANPTDITYHVEDNQFPDSTTIHTGIQWSPDGVGYLLTSKTFNSDPGNTGGDVPFESVSDAFVRNLVTYFSPPTGYQIFTLNESKVTGYPFTDLNQFGQEHYRYAWHPFARYAYFSVFGGFEKYDQDLYVDAGTITVNATVNALNVRIEDGNSGLLADVVADPVSGLNRLAVDADLNTANTPDGPLFVQDEGQMCLEEFDLVNSVVTPADWIFTPVDAPTTVTKWITKVTDWNSATGVVSVGAVPVTATLYFKHPIKISSISLTGDLNEVSVDVIDVGGTDWRKIDTVTNVSGADSGNFEPMSAKGIIITVNNPASVPSTIYELAIWKVHEVKPTVPVSEPLHIEAEQQIVNSEVYTIVGSDDFLDDPNLWSLLDKQLSIAPVTYIASDTGTIVLTLTHPELLSRAVLTGLFLEGDVLTIAYTTADGSIEVIDATVGVGGALILDSGNVANVVVTSVTVTIVASIESGTRIINELVLWKGIETKSEANRNALPVTVDVTGLDEVSVAAGEIYAPDPAAPAVGVVVPPLTNLLGTGTKIEKDYNHAVNLMLTIEGDDQGDGDLDATVLWYYAYDNVAGPYFYFASTEIDDAVDIANPTGYTVLGGTSQWQVAMPLNAYNKYITYAVRNNHVTDSITVSSWLVRQR